MKAAKLTAAQQKVLDRVKNGYHLWRKPRDSYRFLRGDQKAVDPWTVAALVRSGVVVSFVIESKTIVELKSLAPLTAVQQHVLTRLGTGELLTWRFGRYQWDRGDRVSLDTIVSMRRKGAVTYEETASWQRVVALAERKQ